MPLYGQSELLRIHPDTVVLDGDQGRAARSHLDPDSCGPCIQRVFDQFFYDGGGSFNDLAGGNLVHQIVGQAPDLRGPAGGVLGIFRCQCLFHSVGRLA